MVKDLEQKVLAFEAQAFPPGVRNTKIQGKTITLLQSELLGAIHSVVATEGRVGTRIRNELEKNLEYLEDEIHSFEGAAQSYFSELAQLCKEAQNHLRALH